MYREPAPPPPDPEREELEAMAREGRRKRDADRLARAEARAREQEEKSAAQTAGQRKREAAVTWRFAQRASPTFARLVLAQVGAGFLFLAGFCVMSGIALEDHDASALPRLALLVGAAALVMPLLTVVVRRAEARVLADERAWAEERAYGLTGHVTAIGEPVSDRAELRIAVRLERGVQKQEASRFEDALAAIAPRGRITRGKKSITFHSGELEPKELAPWCRDVAHELLPKLASRGITRVTMEGAGEGLSIPDLD